MKTDANSEMRYKFALFDFDGTVSLLREGWQAVMYEYFTQVLCQADVRNSRTEEEHREIVMEFVDKLTGKQTIFQCMRLADEVRGLGGVPEEPLAYKTEYLRRLMTRIHDRHTDLRAGASPEPFCVPGVVDFLQKLRSRGVKTFLASGTDEADVRAEAELLGVAKYFDGIFGANDRNSTECSKELVIRDLIANFGLHGENFISFGDGYVEMELTKAVGGYAVGVATDEANRSGKPDPWKEHRLRAAGADCIIPDFVNYDCE